MENLQRRKWRRLPVLGSVTLLALGVLLTVDNIETWVITELLWLVMRKDEKEEKKNNIVQITKTGDIELGN